MAHRQGLIPSFSGLSSRTGDLYVADWNPSLYLQYAAERSRPAAELLSCVALENVRSVVDLGCGPGDSTVLLHQRWPAAKTIGVDFSPAMLNEAHNVLPSCHFIEADISQFKPGYPVDLPYANASLQWVPDHYKLFPHLVLQLSHNGVLAVQMPDNWLEPTHVLTREVAYKQDYPDRGCTPLPSVHAYYDILTEAGCDVDIWRTTYHHIMDSHQAIIGQVSSMGLRPWLQDLSESEQRHYLVRYHELLQDQYPLQDNGNILLASPWLFIVARRNS